MQAHSASDVAALHESLRRRQGQGALADELRAQLTQVTLSPALFLWCARV